jgi:hypothetical protein
MRDDREEKRGGEYDFDFTTDANHVANVKRRSK